MKYQNISVLHLASLTSRPCRVNPYITFDILMQVHLLLKNCTAWLCPGFPESVRILEFLLLSLKYHALLCDQGSKKRRKAFLKQNFERHRFRDIVVYCDHFWSLCVLSNNSFFLWLGLASLNSFPWLIRSAGSMRFLPLKVLPRDKPRPR